MIIEGHSSNYLNSDPTSVYGRMGSSMPAVQIAAIVSDPGPNGSMLIRDDAPVGTPGSGQVLVKLSHSGIW